MSNVLQDAKDVVLIFVYLHFSIISKSNPGN